MDSTKIVEGVHGLVEEQEDILVRTVDFAEAYRMVGLLNPLPQH